MSTWYCEIDGASTGPFTLEELGYLKSRGQLDDDSRIRNESGEWISAGSLRELAIDNNPTSGYVEAGIHESNSAAFGRATSATDALGTHARPETDPSQTDRPPAEHNEDADWRRRMTIASIATFLILLMLALLLMFLPSAPDWNSGSLLANSSRDGTGHTELDSSGAASGDSETSGSGSATGESAGNSSQGDLGDSDLVDAKAGDQENEQTNDASLSSRDDETSDSSEPRPEVSGEKEPDAPLPTAVFTVKQFQSTPPPATGNDGAGATGGGENQADFGPKTLGGVKLKGRVALVCDVSGSMSRDFPVLYRELRRKFPRSTPLLMVNGCYFAAPNPSAREPTKIHQDGRGNHRILGVNLSRDRNAYWANSTTDAILFAVNKLNRDTVMFNNDLQDSGSQQAIAAFKKLYEEKPFSLAGRSLNRHAPPNLLEFIKESGGDFRVDPIGRQAAPAVDWGP